MSSKNKGLRTQLRAEAYLMQKELKSVKGTVIVTMEWLDEAFKRVEESTIKEYERK